MTQAGWSALALMTLTNPAQAARTLLQLRLGRNVLWLALALTVVLNTGAQILSDMIFPQASEIAPGIVLSPVAYAALFAGGPLLLTAALSFVGPKMGGTGSFGDVFVLVVWLQYLRFALEAVVLLLLLVAPALAMLLGIAGSFVGLYILLHFIDQAHKLNSLGQSVLVLLVSIVAMAVVLYLLLSLAGGPIAGNPSYV